MKRFLKILGGLVFFIALLVAGVFYLTGDMVDASNRFFEKVKAGDVAAAYADLAEGFKAKTSQEELDQFLKANSLIDYKEANWGSRSFENNLGKLDGTVTTNSGQVVPLKIDFVKEGGAWKILGMSRQPAGVAEDGAAPAVASSASVPGNDALVKLVRESTDAFGRSIDAKSMAGFHGYISQLWREQFTIEQLEEAYGKLYSLGAQWSSLKEFSPIFDNAPLIDADGVLSIQGHYLTRPDQLFFTYKYIMEGLEWKLLGLHINFRAPAAAQ